MSALRVLNVNAVWQRARRGIAERGIDPGFGLISGERLQGAVRLHLNSGGNALAAESALVRAGYTVTRDPEWNGYGVKLLVTIGGAA